MSLPFPIDSSEVASDVILTSRVAQAIKNNLDYLGNRLNDFGYVFSYVGYLYNLQIDLSKNSTLFDYKPVVMT